MRLSQSLHRQLEKEAGLLLRFLVHVLVVGLIVAEAWVMELLPPSPVLDACAIAATAATVVVLLVDDALLVASWIRQFIRDV